MMAAILKSAILDSDTAILDSDTLLSSLRFTQKHSHSTLTLTQTNSIWLTWWWQPSWILPSWIQPFCTKLWLKLIQSDSNSFCLIHFLHSTWLNLMIILNSTLGFSYFAQKHFTQHSDSLDDSAILNSAILDSATAIQTPCYLLSDSLKNTLTPLWLWLKLNLTQTHSFLLTWWWQPSWILSSWILPSLIQPFCTKLWLKLNLTQIHSFLILMMAAILKSAILDSTILRQNKTSLLDFILTQLWWWQPSWILPSWILSFWIQQFCTKLCLKLIYSDSTWWCQTSWILPSWIQQFWTKKTSLIHSDSTLWWQTSWILPSLIQLFCTKTLHSYILTHLDDCSHLEFCHVGFSHCHLGFRYPVIISQIHSKTLSLHTDSDSN